MITKEKEWQDTTMHICWGGQEESLCSKWVCTCRHGTRKPKVKINKVSKRIDYLWTLQVRKKVPGQHNASHKLYKNKLIDLKARKWTDCLVGKENNRNVITAAKQQRTTLLNRLQNLRQKLTNLVDIIYTSITIKKQKQNRIHFWKVILL